MGGAEHYEEKNRGLKGQKTEGGRDSLHNVITGDLLKRGQINEMQKW